jgi:nucleoside-diphosphate-sugar epimerase
MKKVCVIGGSGFVGTRLIDLLVKEYEVTIVDKEISEKYPQLFTIANVLDAAALSKSLEGIDTVILLAAEHRDDVTPISLYHDVNVQGTKNVLAAMDKNGVKNIIFTSSVAIYGLDKNNPDETHPAEPFNDYGKTKWEAENILRAWHDENKQTSLSIIRPTVIFGEGNRGNVYNLLKQIASGKFMMVGSGHNVKSLSYVGNVAAFLKYLLDTETSGYRLFTYADKPDFTTIDLVQNVEHTLGRKLPPIRIPYYIGMLGGFCFDILSFVLRKKLSISSVRVKKFCATTQFSSIFINKTAFVAPYKMEEALKKTIVFEFVENK